MTEHAETSNAPSRQPPVANADAASLEDLLRALHEQEEAFATLLNAVPDAVTVLAADGRIMEANLAACERHGRSREAMRALTVYDINPELPKDRIQRVITEQGDGVPFVHETINIGADGRSFPVEVYSRVFRHRDEYRVIAVARDISRRIQAEQDIRASELRYRELLRAMDKGVLVQDREGKVLSINPAACRILRRTEEELLGTDARPRDWDFIDEHGATLPSELLPSMRALRERETIASTTLGIYDREGDRRIWLTVTATPQFRDGESEPFQVISTFSDVTELKRDSDLFLRTQSLARIGGWYLEPGPHLMYWTETMFALLERPSAQGAVTTEQLLSHVHPIDRDRVQFAIEDACHRGSAFDLECRWITGRGQTRWCALIGESQHRDGHVYQVSGTLQDITRDKLLEETLRKQALSDPLTGLGNRIAFADALAAAIERAQLSDGPVVLHVDLDRFKLVNDLLGHAGGDALVRAAGRRLAEAVGEEGTVARMSGDEFLVMLPIGGKSAGQRLAERLNSDFSQPFMHDGEEFSITASVGVAHYPDDGTTVHQLLQSADAAMNESKRRGRNTWQAFTPVLARQMSDRLLIETQLRKALQNDEFQLVYQPQVDLATGHMHSAEALLRWTNRMLGPMRPDLFVPHAESTGDIVRIGAWVIRESCRQLRAWQESGLQLQRIAVNVSFRQFLSEDFQDHVLGALDAAGLPGSALELELTERVLIEDAADTLQTLRRLKEHGVMVSIDDFGEGYSALSYLRRLPIDAIKISHGFMRGIPQSSTDAVLCRSIIQIAQSLGLKVIGEGVENEAQRRFLFDQGADLAQGYLFAQPLTADALAAYITPVPPLQ